MIRLRFAFCLLLGGLSFAAAQDTPLHLASTDRILILAPHPDDEALCCGGVIQQAVANHIPLKLVFLTYGDFNKWSFTMYRHSPVFRPKTMRAMGEVRRQEALAAARVLGVPADALLFLGYPDYETLRIWDTHWADSPALLSRNTRVKAVPYTTAYRPQAPYKGEAILHDLEAILKEFQPTVVIAPHPADQNVDHRALAFFLRAALWDTAQERLPAVYSYLVHFPAWPPPKSAAPPALWENFPLSDLQVKIKYVALQKHRTQIAYSHRFLTSFVRSNELFTTHAFAQDGASADFENWQLAIDSGDLVVTGRLAKKRHTSAEYILAAFGYRRDTPFEKMPKIHAAFKIPRGRRDFTVRIPLKNLNQPEKIFVGCGAARRGKPFNWPSVRLDD